MIGWNCKARRALYKSGLALVAAMVIPFGVAHAAPVVTDHVVSLARQTQANVPVTFGQIFKSGDVPKGDTVVASFDGHPVPLQVNVKATNADGSLRHAVLTALVPKLGGHAREPLAISAAPAAPTGSPVALAALLETKYNATASLDIDGTTYTANARALLAAASGAGSCKVWGTRCSVWLSGSLASEWVVNGPVTDADGHTNPNLRVYFDVRAYAGSSPGAIAYIRTDVVVENDLAYVRPRQPRYTAVLASGTAAYKSPRLTQWSYTRWHKVLWWNKFRPQVYLRQDTQYIQASGAVSRYERLKPTRAFLAKVRQSCAPLHHCDQTQRMANTGAQAAIGPLPRWTSVYILDPNIRAYRWMLANTDALGAYSIHYRDRATGWAISIHRHPYATLIDHAYASRVAKHGSAKGKRYKADLLPACCKIRDPNRWNNAHQPAEGYVAYMVTGSYYYMEEVAFGASHNEIWSNEAYRGYSRGLIDRSHIQIRGKAWTLREMADAAYILPDHYPLKAEFNDDVNNSIADFNKKYTENSKASQLGILSGGVIYKAYGHKVDMAPWQHSFLTWSAGHAAALGFSGAAKFRNWLARLEIGLMTDWQNDPTKGYCWLEASAYQIQVMDTSRHWLPSFAAIYAASFPHLVGLTCNSPAMVARIGKARKRRWRQGEMSGYPWSATGFPANLQIGLASAVDSGLPHAAEAWKIFESRSVKPRPPKAYNDYPNFAVVPRVMPAASTARK